MGVYPFSGSLRPWSERIGRAAAMMSFPVYPAMNAGRDQEITEKEEIASFLLVAQVCRPGLAVDNEPYIVPVCF